MTDEDLRKIDSEQLLAEQEVLEELLRATPWGHQADYWRAELARIKATLQRLAVKPSV